MIINKNNLLINCYTNKLLINKLLINKILINEMLINKILDVILICKIMCKMGNISDWSFYV